ncbi:TetR/AcrR family transcriptional regulator [Shimia biformata]|uniref:TetR/AcrR family transcriptional regulator n=1 Tax=Shimia biformata TaxID=1294299 RepID=UPI00194F4448|nr:TetR/AcrR family transcriptional regulator [Shimia biformata]
MGRTSTFTDEQVFAALARQVAAGGDIKIQELAGDTGVSIGSLYHRYGSREGIMAAAWLDAVSAFQTGFRAALTSGHDDAGERAALATPRFARAQRDRAVILCVGRREALLSDNAPKDIREQVAQLNTSAAALLEEFAAARAYDLTACLHAIVAFPLAAVRLYLPHRAVPASADAYVRAAYRATIEIDKPS